MFDPDHGGGSGGGGDPYDQHPLIVAMKAQVERFNGEIAKADRLLGAMNRHSRQYMWLTIINTVIFGSMAGALISITLGGWLK